jgi:hypothetical protein
MILYHRSNRALILFGSHMNIGLWQLFISLFFGLGASDAQADEALDALVSELESDVRDSATYHLGLGVGNNSVVNVRREFRSSAIEMGAVLTLFPIGSELDLIRPGFRVSWLSFGNSTGDRSIYRGIGLGSFWSVSFSDLRDNVHPSLQLFTGYEVARASRLKWFGQAELDISGERIFHGNSEAFPLSLMFSVGAVFRLNGERP